MEAVQSHFAQVRNMRAIPVASITFGSARSRVELIANDRITPYKEVSFARAAYSESVIAHSEGIVSSDLLGGKVGKLVGPWAGSQRRRKQAVFEGPIPRPKETFHRFVKFFEMNRLAGRPAAAAPAVILLPKRFRSCSFGQRLAAAIELASNTLPSENSPPQEAHEFDEHP